MIYIIEAENGLIKIGQSAKPESRLRAINLVSPLQVRLVAVFAGDRQTELDLHTRFEAQRRHNEWFVVEGPVAAFMADMRGHGIEQISDWVTDHNVLRRSTQERAAKSRSEAHRKLWASPEYRHKRIVQQAYYRSLTSRHQTYEQFARAFDEGNP